MKKLLVLITLLCTSLIHAAPVTIDFELAITGHETIKKQFTFDDPKNTNWVLSSGKITISGNVPDPNADMALIKFKISLQEKDGKEKLISSPSISATWGKKSEVRIVEKETDKGEWKLSLDVVMTKPFDVEIT